MKFVTVYAKCKLVQLNFENIYNVTSIAFSFSTLSLGHTLISHLVVVDIFMHSLSDIMLLLYLALLLITQKMFSHEISRYFVYSQANYVFVFIQNLSYVTP